MTHPLYLLHLKQLPIFEQLQIEEALLRIDNRPFFLLNEGSCNSIVLGISSSEKEAVNQKIFRENPVPIIRRFSGGGSVFVDKDTLFFSWILPKQFLNIYTSPEGILSWAAKIYTKVFAECNLKLEENDFVIQTAKCAGNALYLRKDRFVLHSSFLWDFSVQNMAYLNYPIKVPNYRQGREHEKFLTPLCNYFPSKQDVLQRLQEFLQKEFSVKNFSLQEAASLQKKTHRTATQRL